MDVDCDTDTDSEIINNSDIEFIIIDSDEEKICTDDDDIGDREATSEKKAC